MPLSANLRASAYMSLSMAGFTVNDAMVKTLTTQMNIGQIMFVRGIIIVACLLVYMRVIATPIMARGTVSTPVLLRTGGEVAATVLFLTALANMPLANASAVLQALPLTVALAAALFLGERIGWRRSAAIVVGFVGVLIIIRPGMAGFDVYALLAVGAVLFATLRDIATRVAPADVPSLTISLMTAAAVTVTGVFMIAPLGGWQPMTPAAVATLAGAAIFLFVGYHFIVLAMRIGEIGFVAPFRYTSLLWALVLGLAVFGEFPDALTLLGAGVVVATGLYTLHRERVGDRPVAASGGKAAPPPTRGR